MAKKFFVEIQEIHVQVIEVTADSRDEAVDAANSVLSSGVQQDGSPLPADTKYARTGSTDEWRVWE